jgi:hypothetical protein
MGTPLFSEKTARFPLSMPRKAACPASGAVVHKAWVLTVKTVWNRLNRLLARPGFPMMVNT